MTASSYQKSAKNRRKHPRKLCSMCADYRSRNDARENHILNISVGGALIKTDENFPIGQEFTLQIPFLRCRGPFVATGKVVRKIPNTGIGVRFEGLDQRQRDVINYLWR